MSGEELQLIKEQTRGILHLMKYIKFWRYIEMLQKDSETLNKRLRKWEKWTTEKTILSSKMGEYLCKWQNVKREYAKQNKILTFKNKEIERLNSIIKGLDNTIENLEEVVEHEENIIKEVRKYIDKFIKTNYEDIFNQKQKDYMIKILEILEGGKDTKL